MWLCLHLPRLPLDALHPARPDQPLAVVDAQQRLLLCNAAAAAAGVRAGLLNSAAQAVCPALQCLPAQPRAEADALRSVAAWALAFSPRISLAPPDEIVLEVGASLRLFGGLDGLRQALAAGLEGLDYQVQAGLAPNPLGAQLLARAGDGRPVKTLSELHARLATAPLNLLRWPEKTARRLQAVGIATLGACEALPRDGFIRRYGAAARRELDQLWGRQNDPREIFTPPASFVRSLDLLSETGNTACLLPGFERLFHDLAAQLHGMGCGLLRLQLGLAHGRGPVTQLHLHLQQPGRDPAHWLDLLRHRFERLELPEPVRAIQVRAGDFLALGHGQQTLWPQGDDGRGQALLEELAARLGPESLTSLASHASHCPEQAWRRADPGQGRDAAPDSRPRPLWLLAEPAPIDAARLRDFSPPERLESQWWDSPCERDYHRARLDNGQQLWVFREHARPQSWFIHGLFG